jgi:hypothetical protein
VRSVGHAPPSPDARTDREYCTYDFEQVRNQFSTSRMRSFRTSGTVTACPESRTTCRLFAGGVLSPLKQWLLLDRDEQDGIVRAVHQQHGYVHARWL